MHHYSDGITRLKALCTFPKDSYQQKSFSFLEHNKARTLALILSKSELNVPELSRNNVISLMKGGMKWPTEDGRTKEITCFDDIELLETLGLVSFYAGWLKAHYYLSDLEGKVHETAIDLYRVMRDLYSITAGQDGFVKPCFISNLEHADELLDCYKITDVHELSKKEDGYYLNIESSVLSSLIFTYLWEELCRNSNNSGAMDKWLLISNVYHNDCSPDFECLDEHLKKVFVSEGLKRLESDPQLKISQETLLKQWSDRHSIGSMFYRNTEVIKVNIDVSGTGKSSHEVENPTDITIFTLDEIKNSEAVSKEFDSLINYYDYWESSLESRGCGEWYRQSYFGIPKEIINANLNISNGSIHEHGGIVQLLSISHDSVFIKHVMFYMVPHFGGSDFIIYLLFNEDTSALGYKLLLKYVKENFNSNRFSNDLVVTNAINLACKLYLEFGLNDRWEDMSELLISMAREAIRYGENDSYSFAKEALGITLSSLSVSQVGELMDSLLDVLSNSNEIDGVVRIEEWKFYLLFWGLEKVQNYGIESDKYDSPKIQRMIIEEYTATFGECLSRNSYSVDTVEIFKSFPWKRITDKDSIKIILDFINSPSSWMRDYLEGGNSNYFSGLKYLKSYAQVLMLLNADMDEVSRAVRKLTREIGFEFDSYHYGIFHDGISRKCYLWGAFSRWVEKLSEERFSDLLADIENVTPLDKLLELYRDTNKEIRRNKLLEMINCRSVEGEDLGLNSIESALISACGQGQLGLARGLLTKGRNFLETRFGNSTNHNFVSIRKQWAAYQYKVELLVGVENATSVNDKTLFVRGKKPPFSTGSNKHFSDGDFIKDCGRFKRSIEADILFESDPEKSYRYFDALYNETKEIQYAGKRFSAQLRVLEINSSKSEKYQYPLSLWVDSIKTVDISSLENIHIKNWLRCMRELKRHEDIEKLWLEISAEQRMNIAIATNFCMSLKGRGDTRRAKDIYDQVKEYHKIETLGEVAEKEMQILDDLILNDQEPTIVALLSKQYNDKPKSNDELKRSYDEIFSKSKSLSEILKVISSKALDEFLYSGMMKIMNEILLRKKNLQIHENSDKKTSRITGEDLINDWVTSIFDRQYAYIGLSCRDQKRGGQSESKETPGEIDFFLCDSRNERISIMEAFRLFSNDTTVINTHLNKISGYDQECLGVVFVIAYCDVADFSGLCGKYEADTQIREYAGFTKGLNDSEKLTVRENSSTIKSYREVRYRDGKPITIYHLMLNLRFLV